MSNNSQNLLDGEPTSGAAWQDAPLVRFFRRRGEWFVLLAIILLAAFFRFDGLKEFSQVGGDDVEFRVHIPDHVKDFEYILRRQGYLFPRLQAPFIATVYLSHWDVNEKVTSFAKPFFLLELGILHSIVNLRTPDVYEDIWRLHRWMACLGILTVILMFFLGRKLGGSGAGLVAAFLVAVSPWAVRYSTWALHTVGGGVWLVLTLLAGIRMERRDSFFSNLLYGGGIGICIYYSTSMIWPSFFLVLFEVVRRSYAFISGRSSTRRLLIRLLAFLIGVILPLLIWEGINIGSCRYLEESDAIIRILPTYKVLDLPDGYMPFPERMVLTFQDNAANTGTLPVDHIYFWRHLKESEGWIVLVAVLVSVILSLWLLFRCHFPGGMEMFRILFVFIGVACIMNYTTGTQVARHYFGAGLIAYILTGVIIGWLARRWRRLIYLWLLLAMVVAGLHYHHLIDYRRSRRGPYLVEKWERKNNLTGQIVTMNNQQWDLWPTMSFFHDFEELNQFFNTHRFPLVMYSDYIGLAHGSWFYHNEMQVQIAETFRRCRDIVFSTDSYLSYRPMLFENEFYYWGLYRYPSSYFDPQIKLIPAEEVFRADAALKSDIPALRDLRRRLLRIPPIIIPAWRDRVILPFMETMSRPSYLVPGIVSWLFLLSFTIFFLRRCGKRSLTI